MSSYLEVKTRKGYRILATMLNLLMSLSGEASVHVFQPNQYRVLPVNMIVNYIAAIET